MLNKAEQIVIKNWGNWIMIETKEILDKLKFVIRPNTGLFSCSKYLPFLASYRQDKNRVLYKQIFWSTR